MRLAVRHPHWTFVITACIHANIIPYRRWRRPNSMRNFRYFRCLRTAISTCSTLHYYVRSLKSLVMASCCYMVVFSSITAGLCPLSDCCSHGSCDTPTTQYTDSSIHVAYCRHVASVDCGGVLRWTALARKLSKVRTIFVKSWEHKLLSFAGSSKTKFMNFVKLNDF